MVKPVIFGAIGGGVAAAMVIVLLVVMPHAGTPSQPSLKVDVSTEMVMGVGNVVRLYVTNTGPTQLTNLKIDYGTSSDSLPVLDPGQKVMFSPPIGTKMVTITDDQGVTATKEIEAM